MYDRFSLYFESIVCIVFFFRFFLVLEQNINCEVSSASERILSFNFLSLVLNQHSILDRKINYPDPFFKCYLDIMFNFKQEKCA